MIRAIFLIRACLCVALGAGVLLLPTACGSSGSSDPQPSAGSGGTPGAAGGSPSGGLGGATSPAAGGAAPTMVPAGQLTCGGKLCHAGGHCAAGNTCPAFLSDCFSSTDWDTCDEYCSDHGFSCAEKSCNYNGSSAMMGYTSVGYSPTEHAVCTAYGIPSIFSLDQCPTPILLLVSQTKEDTVRCCCRD